MFRQGSFSRHKNITAFLQVNIKFLPSQFDDWQSQKCYLKIQFMFFSRNMWNMTGKKCFFLRQGTWTNLLFRHQTTYIKKKSFHLIEESLCTFYELKSPNASNHSILLKRFFINRSQIFIALPKLHVRHLGVEITCSYCAASVPYAHAQRPNPKKNMVYRTLCWSCI